MSLQKNERWRDNCGNRSWQKSERWRDRGRGSRREVKKGKDRRKKRVQANGGRGSEVIIA